MKKILWFCVFIGLFFAAMQAQTTSIEGLNPIQLPVEKTETAFVEDTIENSSWVGQVVDWYMNNLNYFSISLLMAVESSFIPFPSEVVVPPAAYAACNPESSMYATESNFVNILLVILFATIGALIGGLINYYLAYFLGRPIVYKFADSKLGHLCMINSEKVQKAENYFVKHGNSSTFVGRLVPGIRQLISIPAGLAKMKITSFLLYTCLGSGIWNIILAVLGYIAHGQQDLINKYSDELSYVLLVLGVVFVAYLVWKSVKAKKNKKKEE